MASVDSKIGLHFDPCLGSFQAFDWKSTFQVIYTDFTSAAARPM